MSAPDTFETKRDATQWLSSVETDRARGHWVDPQAGQVRLSTYSYEWLSTKARLAPRTREIYELQLRLHVLPKIAQEVPALGDVRIGDLTPELVRAWYSALVKARSPSVAAKAYARLRQVMIQAVNDDRIAKNPCRIAGGAVERTAEQRFATLPQLYQVADAVPQRYRALVLMAGYTGLRQGELFALRRADLDLDVGVVIVSRKRQRLASGEILEDRPKSEAGRRRVAMPAQLLIELEAHLDRFSGAGPHDYVFTGSDGGPLNPSNFRNRVWIPAVRSVGLEGLRFHDLRHTAGTLAARTGATTKELMARLGHASPRAAMVYQHATEDRDRAIAEGLAAMAAEAGVAPPETDKSQETRRRCGTFVARK